MNRPEAGLDRPDPPAELVIAVQEFWPESEWENAYDIAYLESGFNAFALADTTDSEHPCGAVVGVIGGVTVTAERSVGWFQVNSCNYPDWEWQRLYNTRHNAGTAHLIWTEGGWGRWYFSALKLGLI